MKIWTYLSSTVILTLFTTSTAFAGQGDSWWHNTLHNFLGGWHGAGGSGGGNSVPELDVSLGPISIALIAGIVAIGLERRRRANKK